MPHGDSGKKDVAKEDRTKVEDRRGIIVSQQ